MGERGVSVDHSTIYRWVQKYAPEIEKRLRQDQADQVITGEGDKRFAIHPTP